MIKLTARQEQILNLIRDAIDNTGFPPTRAEIAAELGFKSANAAEEHLKALQRKGAIEITAGTSRGIRLTGNFGAPASGAGAGAGLGSTASQGAARRAAATGDDELPQISAGMLMQLPLIGRVAAGSPILAQENLETTYNVDPNLFSAKPDFLLKVRGESMRDIGIMDGDLLAVKKADSARNGQIVVARIGSEVTVKRYRKTGSTVELLPENPDFKVITVTPEDDFALEGLAVGLMRTWH